MRAGRSKIPSLRGHAGASSKGPADKRRIGALVRAVVGLSVAGVLLWLASREVVWQDLRHVLSRTHWGWLAFTWLCVALALPIKGLRWRVLLGENGRDLTWPRLTAIFALGQLVNSVIPLRMGEVSRAYLAGRAENSNFALSLGTIVAEKALDGLALFSIVMSLALTLALPDWFGTAAVTYAVVLGAIFLVALGGLFFRARLQRLSRRLPQRLAGWASSGLDGLATLRRRGVLAPSALLTVCVWALGLVSNYSLFIALGLGPTVGGALLLLVVHYLAVLIPGVPAQVGLFHYVTVLALEVLALRPEQSMPYAVVLHGLIYGNMILFGVISAATLSAGLGELTGGATDLRRGEGKVL